MTQKKQQELKDFVTSVDFDDTMEADIDHVINGNNLHEPAHPVTDVEVTVTNINDFEQLVQQCEIDEDHAAICLRVAGIYFKLIKSGITSESI